MQFRSVYTIELERVLNVEKRPLKRRERERGVLARKTDRDGLLPTW